MNLVVDIGNSRTKCALFEGKELIEVQQFEKNAIAAFKKFAQEKKGIKFSIVSSVLSHSKEYLNLLQHLSNCIELNEFTPLPLTIKYATPQTLGKDRIAAACGALAVFKKGPVLSVDCGTCIKFDFVNEHAEYLGGSIAPGLLMRFKALHSFTDKLPLLNSDEQFVQLVGKSTRESILSGVQNGAIHEVLGMINEYKKQFPELKVVLCGGDSAFFENAFKNSIFANPNLVLIGLHDILLHHIEKSTAKN